MPIRKIVHLSIELVGSGAMSFLGGEVGAVSSRTGLSSGDIVTPNPTAFGIGSREPVAVDGIGRVWDSHLARMSDDSPCQESVAWQTDRRSMKWMSQMQPVLPHFLHIVTGPCERIHFVWRTPPVSSYQPSNNRTHIQWFEHSRSGAR
jgi:hypothetical protein